MEVPRFSAANARNVSEGVAGPVDAAVVAMVSRIRNTPVTAHARRRPPNPRRRNHKPWLTKPRPSLRTRLRSTPSWAPAHVAIPIVLPGESLAKYRHAAPAEPVAEQTPRPAERAADEVEVAAMEENEVDENEFDEPVHYPPENALPDAPLHKRTIEPDLVEVPAEPGVLLAETAAEEADAVEFLPETLESAEVSEHLTGDADDEPAVAPLLDDDEDSDIQAMILGDVEGIEIAPSGESAAPGDAAAESGSASVRERGGRFPHRVSRRRRRGRGQGPQGSPDQSDRTRPENGNSEQAHPEMAHGESNGAAAVREDQPRQDRPQRSEHTISRPNQGQPSISDLLKEGQEIIVQIAKEPLGQKGARITSHIALARALRGLHADARTHGRFAQDRAATRNACG